MSPGLLGGDQTCFLRVPSPVPAGPVMGEGPSAEPALTMKRRQDPQELPQPAQCRCCQRPVLHPEGELSLAFSLGDPFPTAEPAVSRH